MSRLSRALAAVAAAILVLSSGAHSLLGWPAMRARLATADVPADLAGGLAMGWHFAGVAMLVLGMLVFWILAVTPRGEPNARVPFLVIGGAYVAFGVGCLVALGWDPFLMTFFVPGVLLTIAALAPSPRAAG